MAREDSSACENQFVFASSGQASGRLSSARHIDRSSVALRCDRNPPCPGKTAATGNARITIDCDDPAVPAGEENLAYRAAQLLLKEVERPTGIHIHIQKRIPLGAGLGGGSTDAAATLLGLNRLFELNVSEARLERLALRLGADVPFFIRARPARAYGIGERLRPVRELPPSLAGNPLSWLSSRHGFGIQQTAQKVDKAIPK